GARSRRSRDVAAVRRACGCPEVADRVGGDVALAVEVRVRLEDADRLPFGDALPVADHEPSLPPAHGGDRAGDGLELAVPRRANEEVGDRPPDADEARADTADRVGQDPGQGDPSAVRAEAVEDDPAF